ncbi:CinA family protein [Umboniibacter marinipuniceus]|uniref:Nicotinamide-nucleotide amidase n=1 Tax=Umboniibacter marinipuniceus TaxID=569599 RepID=A0A3M0A172_9GAMM|nr:CinA family protein [Umboniibacter marinipuniceus]RMA78703.1 nicotinamide-nucleotide amidase [Umboniibacter marinipuniceus]
MKFDQLAAELGTQLAAKEWTVTTAESCTGGMVSAAITSVPGSSAWFEQSYTTYSNASKERVLGVLPAIIESNGVVSEPVVAQMALGAALQSNAECAVAISGIAGPGGATENKAVGTVCFGWVVGGVVTTATHQLQGDRQAVREQSVEIALKGLLQHIQFYV